MSRRTHCTEDNCFATPIAKGLCSHHYYRARRINRPAAAPIAAAPIAPVAPIAAAPVTLVAAVAPAAPVTTPGGLVPTVTPVEHYDDALCRVVGCDRDTASRGLCNLHYQRLLRTGDVGPAQSRPRGRGRYHTVCVVHDCEQASDREGLCVTHYARLAAATGATAAAPQLTPAAPPVVPAPPAPPVVPVAVPDVAAHQPAHRSRPACAVNGCDRDSRSRGLCHLHYNRKRLTGDVGPAQPIPPGPKPGFALADNTVLPNTRTCTIDGCDRRYKAKGLCNLHYTRKLLNGDVGPAHILTRGPKATTFAGTCTIDGCDRRHKAKGLCNLHYTRKLLNGDVGPVEPQPPFVAMARARHENVIGEVDTTSSEKMVTVTVPGCAIRDCARPRAAQGLCAHHYYRVQQSSDTAATGATA